VGTAQTALNVYDKTQVYTQSAVDTLIANLQSQIDSHSSQIANLQTFQTAIQSQVDILEAAYNIHTHGGVTVGAGSTGTTSDPV